MKLSIKITGEKEMINKLRGLVRRIPNEMRGALYRRAEYVMTRSKQEFVPVDLGTLKNSGHVESPKVQGDNVSVELMYGGPAAAYAYAVHFHPSSASPPSWRGVQVKFKPSGHGPYYLQRPLMDAVKTLAQDLVNDGLNFERML